MKRLAIFLLLAGTVAQAQPRKLSVKDFLKLSPADTASYVVQGVVAKVRSTTSGSFYLQDASGTLLVYGLQDPANPGGSFTQLDIVKGDTLTVVGRFTLYGGSTKEMKDGRLLAKANGPDHNLPFYERLSQKPSFKGFEGQAGLDLFRTWVQARIKAPAGEKADTVLVRFVVGRNGGVQEVQIAKGAAPAQNEEALRVVRSAPKWKPAKGDDGEVRVTYTIPVVFY